MKIALTLLLVIATIQNAIAQDVTVTVFDVGAGVCILGEFPNETDPTDNYYMVYDAGFSCDDNIQAVVPVDEQIDLMVLSHNDTDHIATADHILDNYDVKKVIWSGFERPDTDQWVDLNEAIDNEIGTEIINLRTDTLNIGTTYIFGQAYVTFVAGFHTPPDDWGFTPSQRSEYRNAGSILMRIVYKGRSILLTGDIVGRHENGNHPEEHVIAAEKYVIENSGAVPINSDVLIAPHHGGDDGSSFPFIQSVDPSYVIFSAGSHDNYGHPRATVAHRYLSSGIEFEHIFRTDLGDDESKPEHWENESTVQGSSDSSGDDDIVIRLTKEAGVVVEYLEAD